MAGISSKSAGGLENKKKYNGYEFNSDFDINLYESFYRSHDPQLGRFWQLDPKPNEFESLYAAMGNSPVTKFDLLGDTVRIGAERKGADGQADVNSFVQMFGKVTGNTYEMKDGQLVRTNEKLNTESNGNVSGTLSKLVECMITGESNISFTVVNSAERDKEITYDVFASGSVDLKDFGKAEKAGNPFLAAMLGHTFEEHGAFPDTKDRTKANYKIGHELGLVTETGILSEMLGTNLSKRKEVWGADKQITKDIRVSQYTYDYGNVQYVQQQQILRINQGVVSQPYTSGLIIDVFRKK